MSKSILLSAVAAALLTFGVGLTSESSTASAAAPRDQSSYPVTTPTQLQLHPTQVDCRFVACVDDQDCAISSGCSANSCSNPAPGQAFGRCTVRPR